MTDWSRKDPCTEFDWLAEFDCSEREQVDAWSRLSAAERSSIERLEAEVWGSLPCSIDPVAPSAGCKERLMGRLATPEVLPMAPVERAAPRASRWLLPLAAGLALLAVGFAASMVSTVRDQREQLASLRGELERASAGPVALVSDLEAARQNLGLVSSRGVEVCALRPMGTSDGAGDRPYGLLFVAADHQHWYVRVGGLDPAPDRFYRVWFETDEGLVPAGNLVGSELELSSPTMPQGTRAVHVSLERESDASTPSDEIVLFGDDMIQIL